MAVIPENTNTANSANLNIRKRSTEMIKAPMTNRPIKSLFVSIPHNINNDKSNKDNSLLLP